MLLSRILPEAVCILVSPSPFVEPEFHSVFQTCLNLNCVCVWGGVFMCLETRRASTLPVVGVGGVCRVPGLLYLSGPQARTANHKRLSSPLASCLCHHTWLKIYFDMGKNATVRVIFKWWVMSSVEVFLCLWTHSRAVLGLEGAQETPVLLPWFTGSKPVPGLFLTLTRTAAFECTVSQCLQPFCTITLCVWVKILKKWLHLKGTVLDCFFYFVVT